MNADNRTVKILTEEEMEQIAGGHPFEEKIADYSLFRAGIVCEMHLFEADEFFIGGTKISKDFAKSLRTRSKKLWGDYSARGDYVEYARAWKKILADEYGITWNGEMGCLIGYCD